MCCGHSGGRSSRIKANQVAESSGKMQQIKKSRETGKAMPATQNICRRLHILLALSLLCFSLMHFLISRSLYVNGCTAPTSFMVTQLYACRSITKSLLAYQSLVCDRLGMPGQHWNLLVLLLSILARDQKSCFIQGPNMALAKLPPTIHSQRELLLTEVSKVYFAHIAQEKKDPFDTPKV